MCEEPLQIETLPNDVLMRLVRQEALISALKLEMPHEIVLWRRGQVEVHVLTAFSGKDKLFDHIAPFEGHNIAWMKSCYKGSLLILGLSMRAFSEVSPATMQGSSGTTRSSLTTKV